VIPADFGYLRYLAAAFYTLRRRTTHCLLQVSPYNGNDRGSSKTRADIKQPTRYSGQVLTGHPVGPRSSVSFYVITGRRYCDIIHVRYETGWSVVEQRQHRQHMISMLTWPTFFKKDRTYLHFRIRAKDTCVLTTFHIYFISLNEYDQAFARSRRLVTMPQQYMG
jgi:hypothetical protein